MVLISGDFYLEVLKKMLSQGILSKNSKILIAAAGPADKKRFTALGFKNVTATNLDVRMNAAFFKPYKWIFTGVDKLKFKDNSFDFAIVHHGLHHSATPHKGLLELYRVSRYGIMVFEGLDNVLSRLGASLGFSENYELAAVDNHGLKFGGFNNTGIPNFVYRWTENEIIKTIASYEPKAKPEVSFFYGLELPFNRLKKMKNKLFYLVSLAAYPAIYILFLLFYKIIGNRFAFFIKKPDLNKSIYPWLALKNGKAIPYKTFFSKKFR
jgi:ubiquinone/menaquinone biosynthesis C-methylase UbiE